MRCWAPAFAGDTKGRGGFGWGGMACGGRGVPMGSGFRRNEGVAVRGVVGVMRFRFPRSRE